MASVIDDFLDEQKKELFDTFPECATHEDTFKVPEFQLVHRSIVGNGSHGKFETEALKLHVEQKHSEVL